MNRFTKTAAIAGATGIAASLLIASPAAAEEIACTGSLGAITVDNLRVPQGATCLLDGTQVEGTITVKGNARLVAVNVDVDGNVQAENSRRVVVKGGSTVGGSVQIVQSGAARVARTAVNADIQFDANSRPLAALRNTVGGNIQVLQNTGWRGDQQQPGRRKPAVQGERPGPRRRRQHRSGQQGRPVR